jgi:methionyl-tRNA formyltransferase
MVSAPAPAALKVVFFGTPAFGVPTLEAILASRHPVVAVVTQPDRPRGRGRKVSDAPVKARALAEGLPLLQPSTLRDQELIASLARLNADIGVVAAYGRILTESILRIPRLGMINVHASLLPRYRGAAPVHRAIVAGERETGVTIMRMVKELDAGPMLAAARRAIADDETSVDVERDLARRGAALLVDTLDRMALETVPEVPQDDRAATYAPRLTKDDGLIDWSLPAERIHNLVRGLHPWPHAYTFLRGDRFILLRTSASPESSDLPPGTLTVAQGADLRIAAGTGTILVHEIQAEGRRAMGAREFLTGHRLQRGDRFTLHP